MICFKLEQFFSWVSLNWLKSTAHRRTGAWVSARDCGRQTWWYCLIMGASLVLGRGVIDKPRCQTRVGPGTFVKAWQWLQRVFILSSFKSFPVMEGGYCSGCNTPLDSFTFAAIVSVAMPPRSTHPGGVVYRNNSDRHHDSVMQAMSIAFSPNTTPSSSTLAARPPWILAFKQTWKVPLNNGDFDQIEGPYSRTCWLSLEGGLRVRICVDEPAGTPPPLGTLDALVFWHIYQAISLRQQNSLTAD